MAKLLENFFPAVASLRDLLGEQPAGWQKVDSFA